MAYNVLKTFGTIDQGRSGEIRVQLVESGNGEPLYDIAVWNGNWRNKAPIYPGISTEGIKALRDLLRERFGKTAAPKKVEVIEADETEEMEELPFTSSPEPKLEFKKLTDHERVVHALTSIPVNDSNYPLNSATKEQLEEAIAIMEAKPNGNKTRLGRCKAKLATLNRQSGTVTKTVTKEDKPTPAVATTVTSEGNLPKAVEKNTEKASETATVITFPKATKSEPIKKLTPTGEHHSYEEAASKLREELKKFKGDPDSEYVINGVLEACLVDQELVDNVCRPEKSYTKSFAYLYKKAREGHCIMIGTNAGIMDKNTALGFVIEYFGVDESQPESTQKTKAPTETRTTTKTATTRKTTTKTKKTWGKRGRK